MTEARNNLYFEHLKGQAQFAYFQLGIAASAIAFALHETNGHALADTPWPIGAAVGLWALSFAFGCFGVDARQIGIAANISYLEATRDGVPSNIANPELRAALENAKEITQKRVGRPVSRFRWQLWSLFIGALFYIGGHVMVMASAPRSGAMPQQVRVGHAHDARPPP